MLLLRKQNDTTLRRTSATVLLSPLLQTQQDGRSLSAKCQVRISSKIVPEPWEYWWYCKSSLSWKSWKEKSACNTESSILVLKVSCHMTLVTCTEMCVHVTSARLKKKKRKLLGEKLQKNTIWDVCIYICIYIVVSWIYKKYPGTTCLKIGSGFIKGWEKL